ncbi:MAG TPA: hypothetical protein VJU84_21835 [Pyrinomonadaceae bacterium]|nr:hypothetical protein [Pyrinomonadaceae bacterium]
MASSFLSFVCTAAQAISVRDRWGGHPANRTVVCLDEGLFNRDDATALFGPDVTIVGRAELELLAQQIFEQAVSLAEDWFAGANDTWPAKVDEWLMESHKRWLLYAVHSLHLIDAAFKRFPPNQIWSPDYTSLSLTLSPDTDPSNPLFFDLLASICRRAGIPVNTTHVESKGWLPKALLPLKYVGGEWIGLARKRHKAPAGPVTQRPVMIDNLDNDFHRHFDLSRLGAAARMMFAWIRKSETVVPVEELLEQSGLPKNTRFAWLYDGTVDWSTVGYPSGVTVRRRAGLRYLLQSVSHRFRSQSRRSALKQKQNLPWLDVLLDMDLPAIHTECRVAAEYYCVFEYERARSIILKWKPELYVTAADHWPYLPHVAAAKDQRVKTLSTESGLSFLQDNFAQKRADIICVFGQLDAENVAKSYPNARVVIAGDALTPTAGASKARRHSSRRVLFVMSGRMFGWWFGSLIFDYPAYMKALVDFAEGFHGTPTPVQVVLKSHPVSDLHEVYDKMVDKYPDVFVQHRKEPMSDEEIAEFDVAVVFGAASAFIAELIRARVPVVYFTGALTEFGKNYHKFDGLDVSENVADLIQRLTYLLDADGGEARRVTLQHSDDFFDRYVDPQRRSFVAVLEEVLQTRATRVDESSGVYDNSRESPLPKAVAGSSRAQPR